ncbi:S9 family peptidase [Rhizohabitans arisaemae]|uniref:S9 family peptidase n=1 Tax=Rhizohabitans arisaemae TaxID=2720610 RepID=UPI0024B26A5D|nr:S9 family peptidase [Rhizohabitans arisaemae]
MARLTLDDLYRLRIPSDPQLRPDGDAVAYTLTQADPESDENRSQIWLAEPGAKPRRLTGGPSDSAPRWSPDGRTLAFLRAAGGPPQIWLLPMDGGEPRALTEAPLGAGAPVWSPDGTALAYSGPCGDPDPNAPVADDRLGHKADGSGLLRGLTVHVHVVTVATGEVVQVTSGDFFAGAPTWSPDGTALAFVADLGEDRDLVPSGVVCSVEAGGGEPKALTGPDTICTGAWWRGDRLLVTGHSGGPTGHARLFELVGGELVELAGELDRNVMVGSAAYPGGVPQLLGDDVVFCARDRGFTHVYRAPGEKIVGGDRVVAGVSVAAGKIAYVAGSPHSAGEVFRTDLDETIALTDHALPGVELFTPSTRVFTAPDGTPVEAFLLADPDREPGPAPLLLDVHGGPHNAWAPVFDGVHLYHQLLAEAGWTVLTVNPRASDGYGEAFFTGAIGAWGIADVDDLHTPVDVLVAEGVADPARLAVTGYSYGGYMTCRLTAITDRFAAAIPGGVVTDLISMAGTSDAGYFLKAYECVADLPAQSPMTFVDQVVTPTLILHGQDDDRCPIGQAEQWFAALRERRIPVRLVRYPGGSHLFIVNGRPSHRRDYNERIITWLEQWIPGAGMPGSPS